MSASTPNNVKNFGRGAVIAEEGSQGGGFYILLTGRVGVFKQDIQVAEFATRGVIFGEISSLLSRPRTARLVAIEPSSVMYFEASVDELIAKHPNVAKTVLISLAQRLERTTEALWTAVQTNSKLPEPAPAASPVPPASVDSSASEGVAGQP